MVMVIILTLRWLRQEDLEVHCETLSPLKEIKNKTVRRKGGGWRERENKASLGRTQRGVDEVERRNLGRGNHRNQRKTWVG